MLTSGQPGAALAGQRYLMQMNCMSTMREKMIKGYNIKGDHYFYNDSQTQILQNNLEFEGYPTYMIINKGGTLINKSAPRPSSKEVLRKRLDKLII